VTLQMTVVKAPLGSVNTNFDLRHLQQPWAETQVSWNSRLTGVPWQQPGATDTVDCATSASSAVFVSGAGIYTFPSTSALIADVQGWVNDSSSNFGWLLVSEGEGTPETARRFATREDPINTPVLTVTYSVPTSLPAAPTISQPTLANNEIIFSFEVQSNQTYAIEFRSAFNNDNWQILTNIPAQPTSSMISVTDPITSGNRFYRVRSP
jgi:hypothetical protein